MKPQFPMSYDLGHQKASHFMTTPVMSAESSCTIATAMKIMTTHRVSGLAIVDSNKRILGSYSEWDAMVQGATQNLDSPIEFKTPPLTARTEAPFRSVLALMIKHRVKRIFIVDDKNYLMGLITRSDILRYLHEDYERERKNKK